MMSESKRLSVHCTLRPDHYLYSIGKCVVRLPLGFTLTVQQNGLVIMNDTQPQYVSTNKLTEYMMEWVDDDYLQLVVDKAIEGILSKICVYHQ